MIIDRDHARHLNHFGMLSGPNVAKNHNFGQQTFMRKIKSMEKSRNMKCTHNVDEHMAKIIDKWGWGGVGVVMWG